MIGVRSIKLFSLLIFSIPSHTDNLSWTLFVLDARQYLFLYLSRFDYLILLRKQSNCVISLEMQEHQ